MNKDNEYYLALVQYGRQKLGSYEAVAKAVGAPSGPAVQMWRKNGVAYRWRPELDRVFGAGYRKSIKAAQS